MDRTITIAVGSSRTDINWKNQETTVSALFERLRTPIRGTETQAEYMSYPKAQQDKLKDVGGFVAGKLNGGRRKAGNILGRDVVTLDLDMIPPFETDRVLNKLMFAGVEFCAYSTRKHTPEHPRLRILYPLSRTVSVDEYEPIARRLAEQVGIDMADPTTFEPGRLMYWPSCSADGEYVYKTGGAVPVDADRILSGYTDWRNVGSWPRAKGETVNVRSLVARQGEPTAKNGVVGAFCRIYDIPSAMELIPGVYAEVAGSNGQRFTYCGGSTTGGAVLYENGQFLYSHHATDPCSGRLVNAFDMIRLHKFGDRDAQAKEGTPNNKLPSYIAMCEYATEDSKVSALMTKERHDQALKDFQSVVDQTQIDVVSPEEDDLSWMQKLDITAGSGAIKNTIDNCLIIMENDARLKDRFALNEFSGRVEVRDTLPWDKQNEPLERNKRSKRRAWSDDDDSGMYWYMEKVYGVNSKRNIDAAVNVYTSAHAFDDLQDFVKGLKWDGVNRLDTFLIDYLGAEDTPYVRAVTRKAFTAGIARAMIPGCKHDSMLILCGTQGIGKSTLFGRMSMGWFQDNIRSFDGKEASELLQGVWIVEVQELNAFKRSEVSSIKSFVSASQDRYRAAYDRRVKDRPRRCVFFGTSNENLILQDTTGNRRFWPVDVDVIPRKYTVDTDLTEDVVRQIWAEAKVRWQMGEKLYLTGEMERIARQAQEEHREANIKEGLISAFVSRMVPEGWLSYGDDARRDYWVTHAEPSATEQGAVLTGRAECVDKDGTKLVKRDRISSYEVLVERLNFRPKDIRKSDSQEINSILALILKTKKAPASLRVGPNNVQRGFRIE